MGEEIVVAVDEIRGTAATIIEDLLDEVERTTTATVEEETTIL